MHVIRAAFTRGWMYNKGWIQANKDPQSFSLRAVPTPTPSLAEQAWHSTGEGSLRPGACTTGMRLQNPAVLWV